MSWLIFAFLAAFLTATKDAFGKKIVNRLDVSVVAWAWRFFALPFLLPFLFIKGVPDIGKEFWPALLISGSLLVVATLFYIKAIKASDLSITMPILSFSPLFLLVTSPLILNEFPGPLGLSGMLLIVAGAYILNFKERNLGYFEPFKKLLKEPGPRYMLIVCLIFSIGANVDKIGVRSSSALFWVIATDTFAAICLAPVMMFRARGAIKQIKAGLGFLVLIGLFNAAGLVCQMIAINMTLVGYVIAVKRTSVIISSLYGFYIFKEKGMKERLLGAMIMMAGVLCIAFAL